MKIILFCLSLMFFVSCYSTPKQTNDLKSTTEAELKNKSVKIKKIKINYDQPSVNNIFSRSNPQFKPRAASFYDRKYLPGTADYLIEVCGIKPKYHPYVMDVLRAYLYEWVDAQVRHNGTMPQKELYKINKAMDDRLKSFFTEEQIERYPAWRNNQTGKNKFRFLIDYKQPQAIRSNYITS